MLGRDPDAEGLNLFTQLLTSGAESRGTIRAALAYSQEETNSLTTLINDVTGSPPIPGQIAGYEMQLTNGTSLTTVIAPLVSQAQGEIDGLYQQVLGRNADSGGLATFSALVPTLALEGHTPIATIRSILAYSPEETSNLTTLYTNVFGQSPTAA